MITFAAACGTRPITLSEPTRALCKKSLDGFFGDRAFTVLNVSADDIPGFAQASYRKQYDLALDKIVKECPIYINEDELLVGSASLGDAIYPAVPVVFQGAHPFIFGVHHVTMGFDRALHEGLDAYEARLEARLQEEMPEENREILLSMQSCLASLRIWHSRYMQALAEQIACAPSADKARLQAIRDNLSTVPFAPPATFYQALQSLWFMFAFARLTANWSGFGRIDQYLWPYLEADLAYGRTTEQQAMEQLAHFFIKGCEWISNDRTLRCGTGDAQHYQNIILGGIDATGKDITNLLTRMVLRIVAELPIGDFPIAVRINDQTPSDIYELIALNTSLGGGVVAVYNEPKVLETLDNYGYPQADAVCFANDGCWEVQIPGKTWFSYTPFDGYAILQKEVLQLDGTPPDYATFEALYSAYVAALANTIDNIIMKYMDQVTSEPLTHILPVPFCELLTEGCMETGRPYYHHGPKYNVTSPHIGGFADIVNALYAIKQQVFIDKKHTFAHYMHMLQQNWEGYEAERRDALSLHYFGNDNQDVDELACRLLTDYADIVDKNRVHPYGELRPAGISTFGRQTEWRNDRCCHAFGMKQGDILSGNGSPTPGTDLAGVTAVIRSHCKLDVARLAGSTALDIRLDPSIFKDTDRTTVVRSLIEGFTTLGGFFMQMDTVDNEILRLAQENPDAYRSLSVRVSGWSARFITLSKEWQETIIERTAMQK